MGIKLFIPCFLDQCAPQVAGAVVTILERLGVAGEYPGSRPAAASLPAPRATSATARRLMRHFLQVFDGAETILCPSASCAYLVRRGYPELAECRRSAGPSKPSPAGSWSWANSWPAGGRFPGPPD